MTVTILPNPKPAAVTLSAQDLRELSPYLGINVQTHDDLMTRIKMLSTVRVDNIDVILEPGLLTRLRSRCPTKVDFPAWLVDVIKSELHAFVGW